METEKVKHIRNFAKIRKQIIAHYDKMQKDFEASLAQAKDFLARVRKGEKGLKWPKTEYDVTESGCLEQISRMEECLRPPYRGKPRKHTVLQWRQQALDRLDRADRAGKVTEITFKIEWHRSRTWGNCPSCETWVHYEGEAQDAVRNADGSPMKFRDGKPVMMSVHYNPRTYASGCGYCKRSTVMSDGIQCPAIDRLVIEHEKCWDEYAIGGRDCLPHLSFGGKGVETLRALFYQHGGKAPIPGFSWEWQEGRNWDYIHIARLPTKRGR